MSSDEEDKDWERCAAWLERCNILSQEQRVALTCVDHLAFCLRDGVLLCLLLNRLHSGAVESRSFSQRPQMSQFLCLKNIRVFLQSCKKVFGLKDAALFDPSDLFDMKDFNKVINTLALLSQSREAKKAVNESFTTENDEEYIILTSESPDDNVYSDHIYGNSADDADEDVYGQLVDYHPKQAPRTSTISPRDHCIKEIVDTENNYLEVLNMIVEKFMEPLKNVLPLSDYEIIFRHIVEMRKIHRDLLSDLARAKCAQPTATNHISAENTIPGCFVKHKMKLVIYGDYCANLSKAQERLEINMKTERVRTMVEMKSEEAKVKLRDILVIPFQRILKYHLLIGELSKHTDENSGEKAVVEFALEEMQDISMYVNEVKRDSENMVLISEIENSISDLSKYMQRGVGLQQYGRRLHDGDVKLRPPKEKNFENRYAFLLDKLLIICRPRGDNYIYKDVLALPTFKLEDHVPERPEKGISFYFKLTDESQNSEGGAKVYIFGVKTQDQKEKWMASIDLAKSNLAPDGCEAGGLKFRMFSFVTPTVCDVCKKLLKGVFFQGYRCQISGLCVHKECIKKASDVRDIKPNAKVKAIAEYNGQPPPVIRGGQPLAIGIGDVIIVDSVSGDWIKGRFNNNVGYFPKEKVRVLPGPQRAYEEAVVQSKARLEQPQRKDRLPPPQPEEMRRIPPPAGPGRGPVPAPPGETKKTAMAPRLQNSNGVSKRSQESSEAGQPWFAGPISRQAATELLQDKQSGTFLIRYSPDKQEYALSISDEAAKDNVRHIRVHKDERGYYLAVLAAFEDLKKLVEYYTDNSLKESFPNVLTCLRTPYQWVSQSSAAASMEPGTVGYCIALHDYEATETNQLSFSVNDKIAIISKTSVYPLWWRGRLNGKTGIVPSNYVKEL